MKKTLRKILSLVLVFVMALSLTNIGYADNSGIMPCAGTETWYFGEAKVGEFTLVGTNLTPVKTMGDSGKLRVYGFAKSNNGGKEWGVKVQIQDAYSGKVLGEVTTAPNTADSQGYVISLDVTKGQQFRIYMYYDKKPTNNAVVSIYYLFDAD